jgi:hypothetical protein
MRKVPILSVLVFSFLLLAGCAGRQAAEPESLVEFRAPSSFDEGTIEEPPMESGGLRSENLAQDLTETLVIRNADLTLVVVDPAQTSDDIGELAEDLGGFVVSSNVYQTSYGTSSELTARASIVIRVPAEKLSQAVDEIEQMAVEVQQKNISGEDVTQEYTDLQSQLRNLELAEDQLAEIMDSTRDAEDTLRVFEQLRQIRGEIEIIKGRISYLENSARLSRITVDLIPDVLAQPIQIGGWRPQGTVKDAVETLVQTLQFLADAGIWLVICVLPVALLIGLPGFFIGRSIYRRRRGQDKTMKSEGEPS